MDIWDDPDLPGVKATAVNQARMATYGHPYNSHALIAALWSGYLGVDLAVEDVSAMMILLKVAREKTGGFPLNYPDNLEDIVGFANTLYAVKEVRRGDDLAVDEAPEREGRVGSKELSGGQDALQHTRRGRGAGRAKSSLPQAEGGDQG